MFNGMGPRHPGLRALVWFWAAVIGVVVIGIVVLLILGPPDIEAGRKSAQAESAGGQGASAARRAERPPMELFAAPFDKTDRRIKVGILFAGFGMSRSDTMQAIESMPAAVSPVFSPYASSAVDMMTAAREKGMEFYISIPMEPQGYPLNDAGPRSLLVGEDAEKNSANLAWALGRQSGFVGVTNALGNLRGERFAAAGDAYTAMLAEIARRGLIYIDARPLAAPPRMVHGRSIDLIIDEPPIRDDIDQRLADLEKMARDRGSALGFIGVIRPVTIERLNLWANLLPGHGLVLVPVSALTHPPPRNDLPR